MLLFICRDESRQQDEDEPQHSEKKKKKKKRKEAGLKTRKLQRVKWWFQVDTLTKARGGKHQAILGVQQGSQKLTVKMLFNKSSSSSYQLKDLDIEELEQQKSKKWKKDKSSKDNKTKNDVETPEKKELPCP